MQVVDLQVGDSGVAGIHFSALLQHGLGKFSGPCGFVFRSCIKRRALLIGCGQLLDILEIIAELVHTVIHFLYFAAVTAQQIIAEVKPVLKDLEANVSGRLRNVLRLSECRLGTLLVMYCPDDHTV